MVTSISGAGAHSGLTADMRIPAIKSPYGATEKGYLTGEQLLALGITNSAAVATTSGTAINLTGIPSWANRITVNFDGVSLSATAQPFIRLGDSGGIETTGYAGTAGYVGAANASGAANFTTGFMLNQGSYGAADVFQGTVVLTRVGTSNKWLIFGAVGQSNASYLNLVAGSKTLSATLDRIQIGTVAGTATFDAGSLNITWEL